jgi:hypothetical protein
MFKQVLLVTSCLMGISLNETFAGLQEDIDGVKNYAQTHHQLSLALGVNDEEKSLGNKFDQNWVYLDDTNTKNIEGRHLNINFNNLDELTQLAEELPEQFSKLVLDNNVYKFTNWTVQHLESFKKTLKDGGTFQFQPDYFVGTDEEILDQSQLREKLRFKLDDTKLERTLKLPSEFPIEESEYKDEIKEAIEKRKQNAERVKNYATHMDITQFQRKCIELDIKSEDIPPHHILGNPDPSRLERYFSNLEQRLAWEINKQHFCDKFFEEILLPHNEMVLKKVFSKVELKRKTEYPIPSSTGTPRTIDYFVCTK